MPLDTRYRRSEDYYRKDTDSRVTIFAIDLALGDADLPGDKDVYVFAHTVQLHGTIKAPGKSVLIYARRVVAVAGATLDVSGLDGEDFSGGRATDGGIPTGTPPDGKPGANGRPTTPEEAKAQDGKSGGAIRILAGTIEGVLTLLSNGGRGGGGQPGGNGSDGFKGADGADGPGRSAVDAFFGGDPGGDGGSGGNAGQGGKGGNGGPAGTIDVRVLDGPPGAALICSSEGGKNGLAGTNGRPGKHGGPGRGGADYNCHSNPGPHIIVANSPPDIAKLFRMKIPAPRKAKPRASSLVAMSAADVTLLRSRVRKRYLGSAGVLPLSGGCSLAGSRAPDGRPGDHDGGVPSPALDGDPGASTVASISGGLIEELRGSASVTQFLMALHAAELAYLNRAFDVSAAMFDWIARISAATPSSTIPIPDVDGVTAGSAEWAAIADRAGTMLSQIRAGLDYFGMPAEYVPLLSMGAYTVQVESLLHTVEDLEVTYAAYFDQQETDANQLSALDRTIFSSEQAIRDLQSEQSELEGSPENLHHGGKLDDVQNEIERLTHAVLIAQELLRKREAEFADVVRPDCSLNEVFQAISMIMSAAAGVEGAVTGIVAAGKSYGRSAHQLPDVIKLIKGVAANYGGIRDGYRDLVGLFPGEPDAAKMLVRREELNALLEEYKGDKADALKRQLDTYLAAVEARNQKVAEYTALALRAEQVRGEIVQKTAEVQRVRDARATLRGHDPGLPEYVAFVGKALDEARSMAVRSIAMEYKAFEFWSLRPSQLVLFDRSKVALQDAHDKIGDRLTRQMEAFARGSQAMSFAETEVVLRAEQFPMAFEMLRAGGESGGRFDFVLNARDNWLGPGRSMVRVSGVRLIADDVITTDGTLVAYLIHNGHSQFVDTSGTEVRFSHASRVVRYQYDVSTGEPPTLDPNNLTGEGPAFADISPYSHWTLLIPDAFNHGLDRSGISAVRLRFAGRFMPLNAF